MKNLLNLIYPPKTMYLEEEDMLTDLSEVELSDFNAIQLTLNLVLEDMLEKMVSPVPLLNYLEHNDLHDDFLDQEDVKSLSETMSGLSSNPRHKDLLPLYLDQLKKYLTIYNDVLILIKEGKVSDENIKDILIERLSEFGVDISRVEQDTISGICGSLIKLSIDMTEEEKMEFISKKRQELKAEGEKHKELASDRQKEVVRRRLVNPSTDRHILVSNGIMSQDEFEQVNYETLEVYASLIFVGSSEEDAGRITAFLSKISSQGFMVKLMNLNSSFVADILRLNELGFFDNPQNTERMLSAVEVYSSTNSTSNSESVVNIICEAISQGCDFTNMVIDNDPIVIWATIKRHTQIVELLLEKGVDPNLANKDGLTPLYVASRNKHTKLVKLLLSNGANPNLEKENVATPLFLASRNGHMEIVTLLLNAEANPNLAYSCNELTPLYVASLLGHSEVVKTLLSRGAKPNLSIDNGISPLYRAAYNGYTKTVEHLLNAGADPNLGNEYGVTPLHIASQGGYKEIVQILLDAGANPDLVDKNGVTPFHIASQGGYKEIVQILLDVGAKPNLINKNGETPLYTASLEGHTIVIELLLNVGADPNLADRRNGVTPLYIASQGGYKEIVKLLLDAGADINAFRDDGSTPITIAIVNNQVEVVKVLLPKVNLDLCEWDGRSIKELIIDEIQDEEEKRELLKILDSQKAKITPSISPVVNEANSVIDSNERSNN